MRPAGWPPMDMSKKTCGIAMVFSAAVVLHLCGRVLAVGGRGGFFASVCVWALSAPSAARAGHLWLLTWLQRLACACAPAEPGLAACLLSPQRGPRGAIFCSAQRDRVAVVVAGTLLLAIGCAMVIMRVAAKKTSLALTSPATGCQEPVGGPAEHCCVVRLDLSVCRLGTVAARARRWLARREAAH